MKSCLLGALVVFASLSANAALLDFESPLPPGLAPVTFWQDTPVLPAAVITNQYADRGVIMSNVALVALGNGHAPSGQNGLSGISNAGLIDYKYNLIFTFVMPADGTTPATTDRFSVDGDRGGGSLNVVTIYGFDFNDILLGSVSFTETGTLTGMTLDGIGQFHRVEITSTLYDTYNGGIGLDLVSFGELTPIKTSVVMEPAAAALTAAALLAMVACRRRPIFRV